MPTATPEKLRWLPKLATAAGVLCIALALLMPTSAVQRQGWTEEDASQRAKLSSQYHRSAYQSPAELGLSKEEYEHQQEQLRLATEALDRKLQEAIDRPGRWRNRLLWTGLALAAAGGAGLRLTPGN